MKPSLTMPHVFRAGKHSTLWETEMPLAPNTDDDASRVTIPQVSNPLRPEDYVRLQAFTVSHSSASSIDQYLYAVRFVQNVISEY